MVCIFYFLFFSFFCSIFEKKNCQTSFFLSLWRTFSKNRCFLFCFWGRGLFSLLFLSLKTKNPFPDFFERDVCLFIFLLYSFFYLNLLKNCQKPFSLSLSCLCGFVGDISIFLIVDPLLSHSRTLSLLSSFFWEGVFVCSLSLIFVFSTLVKRMFVFFFSFLSFFVD